jgi:AraC family transcriptional regulator, regulatory protein of adaptative response / methylated-DNA-[protein]-cysteine methyltransferase
MEKNPEKRWSEKEIVSVGVDPSVLRKQCKKRFGMTFLSFSRLRRVAVAILDLQNGNALLDTQIKYGFESSSGFRDACKKVLSDKSSGLEGVLHVDWIDTRLGTLVAVSRYNRLFYLNFINEIDVSYQLRQLSSFLNSVAIPSPQPVHFLLRSELKSYFKDFKLNFCVPLTLSGSPLEQAILQRIVAIPVGSTELWVDILDEHQVTEKEISFEQLIQSNPLALLVPLHRVTMGHAMTNDRFTLDRASWLLRHECQPVKK